jgi:hypothetical protein
MNQTMPIPTTCFLCNRTDQEGEILPLPPTVHEIVRPFPPALLMSLGLCVKCRGLSRDEMLALVAMILRNGCILSLIEHRVPLKLARAYAAEVCPVDEEGMKEFLRHPPRQPEAIHEFLRLHPTLREGFKS